MARLATAASMGGQMPLFSPELSTSLGLTNQIYQALSGQLSGNLGGQLNNSLGGQLSSVPSHTNGLGAMTGNNILNMARAGSAHLPSVGSAHLPVTLAQQVVLPSFLLASLSSGVILASGARSFSEVIRAIDTTLYESHRSGLICNATLLKIL